MKTVTLEIPDEQWGELEHFWNHWSDESFVSHAAYFFRDALIRAGYMEENE